jgi:O-antigen/teichoic acid export membrane protein
MAAGDDTNVRLPGLVRDLGWNVVGIVIPAILGFIFIPVILTRLGPSQFGVLSQVWVLCGYAGLFDFGFGMVLTRLASTYMGGQGANNLPIIRSLIRISWGVIGILTLILYIVLLFLNTIPQQIPAWLVSSENRAAIQIFLLLVLISSLTSVYRGIIVGKGDFFRANLLRILIGLATFGAPILATLGSGIVGILGLFAAMRLLALVLAMYWARLPDFPKASEELKGPLFPLLRRELRGSGIMFALSLLMPMMAVLDRGVMTSHVVLGVIGVYNILIDTFYKCLIWPNAISNVALQRFAGMSGDNHADLRLFNRLQFQVVLFTGPMMLLAVIWGHPALSWWLKAPLEFLDPRVVSLLALGFFFSSMAQVPSVVFFARKGEHLPLMVNLLELPFYFLGLRWAVQGHGLMGIASVVAARMFIDCVLFHILVWFEGIKWDHSKGYRLGLSATFIGVGITLLMAVLGRP